MRNWKSVVAVSAAFAAAPLVQSCDGSGPPGPPTPEHWDLTGMLVGEAAQSLDSTGRFRNAVARPSVHAPTITPDRARALAIAYAAQFGPFNRDRFESLHGAAIDFASLRAAATVTLAESPVEELPTDAALPSRKHFGDYYIVRLRTQSGADVLQVAVSAFSADIAISAGGLTPSGPYGNEFRTWVVTPNGAGAPALAAEDAAARAFAASGRMITEPPRFVRKGVAFAPHLGAWRIVLDEPIEAELVEDGSRRSTSQLYVDGAGEFLVPATASVSDTAHYQSSSGEQRRTVLAERPELTVRLQRVTVRRGMVAP